MKKIYCRKCGYKIFDSDTEFCPRCGTRVNEGLLKISLVNDILY